MKDVDFYIENIDNLSTWVDRMKNTIQDSEYHAEGDVWTHTSMVLKSLVEDKDFDNFNENEKEILYLSALFHDIGKFITTKNENGKIISKGHSKASYHITYELLNNIDLYKLVSILHLIKLHGHPIHFLEKSQFDIEYEVIKNSHLTNNKLLYYLVKADLNGRKSNSDIFDYELILDYYKDTSIKLNCWDKPFEFYNKYHRYLYLVEKSHHYIDTPYNDRKSNVYLMSGLPGSGKDYYINKNLNDLNIISLDNIRKQLKVKPTDNQGKVISFAMDKAKEYLRKGEDFVWNATNTSYNIRQKLLNTFNLYKPYINWVYIHDSYENILSKNKSRNDVEIVPDNVIFNLMKKLEIPTILEGMDIKYIENSRLNGK